MNHYLSRNFPGKTTDMITPPLRIGKTILASLLFCLFSLSVLAQTDRQVVMVVDDSGSMTGAKYEAVIYAFQLLTALLEPEDELYIVRGGQPIPVNLSDKQAEMDKIAKWPMTGMGDYRLLPPGMEKIEQGGNKQKWFIVAADGEWGGDNTTIEPMFTPWYEAQKPFIKFLSINEATAKPEKNTLKLLLEQYQTTEILPTAAESNSDLRNNLAKISSEVISVSGETQIKAKKLNDNTVSFSPELPLKKLIIIYQDNVETSVLPLATSINNDLQLGGNWKASNFGVNPGRNMNTKTSGRIQVIQDGSGSVIPAGQTMKISFDKTIDVNKLKIIPICALEMEAYPEAEFEEVDEANLIYKVCNDVETAIVKAEIKDTEGNTLKPAVLKKVKVTLGYGGKEKKLKLVDGVFQAEIPLKEDKTVCSVRADYPGYFDYKAQIFTIEKVNCYNTEPPEDIGNVIMFPETGLSDFTDDGNCFDGKVFLPDGTPVSPDNFELTMSDPPRFVDFEIEPTKDGWKICRSIFTCRCFLKPGTYQGEFLLKSKNKRLRSLKGTWSFTVKKEGGFLSGCYTCLWILLGTILLAIYLFGFFKKKRFAKGAIMEYERYRTELGQRGKPQTRKLHAGFFKKWVVPFVPERVSPYGFMVEASDSKSHIILPQKSQTENMFNRGRPILKPGKKDELLRVNTKLEVHRRNRKDIYTYKFK